MGFMDKVKSQTTQLAAKAQEAGKAGQAKIESMQAKRKADALFGEIGTIVYAQHTGTAEPDAASKIESLVEQLRQHEAEHGLADVADDADGGNGVSAPSGPAPTITSIPTSGGGIPTARAMPEDEA